MTSAAEQTHLNPLHPPNLLNPFPLYKELREKDPVHWSEAIQSWIVTRHQDVMNGFRDPHLSNDRTVFYEHQLRGLDPETVRKFVNFTQNTMVMRDGGEHTRLRRQALAAFTPQMVESWVPVIGRLMDEQLARVASWGKMDLVKEISYQLPALVIADIFGVPAEDCGRFQEWAAPLAQFSGPGPEDDILEVSKRAAAAMTALTDYLAGLAEQRRHTPGNDVLSRMLQVKAENAKMSMEELVVNALLMLSAGHLTTTDQISNLVHDLLTNPEQLQKLRADPSLIRSAVEENLRFSPSTTAIIRIAVADFQLHGRSIRKGDRVMLVMAAANRDPAVFPDPDRFDITRNSLQAKHLTFSFGQHHCLGSGLARRELEIATLKLLEQLPDLRLDEAKPARIKASNVLFRGFESLSVRW